MNENLEKVNEEAPKNEEQNVVRNRSEKVVVEYRKPSFFMSLLLILIGVCLATIVLLLVYIFKIKPQNEVKPVAPVEQTEVVEEPEKEETKVPDVDLSVDGEFVKGLRAKIPSKYYMMNTYNHSKVTENLIPTTDKTLFVLEDLRRNEQNEEIPFDSVKDQLTSGKYVGSSGETISSVEKITIDRVKKEYKNRFGNELIALESIDTNLGYVYEYSQKDECFYGHSYGGGGGFGTIFGTKIINAQRSEDGKEIYVYEYYLRYTPYGSPYGNVFTYSVNDNAIGEETEESFMDNYTSRLPKDEMFEKYKDKLVQFKSTFKLDTNGNYYWVSTEPVK